MWPFTKKKKKNSVWRSLLIATSVIVFWRTIWGLLDVYFYPENPFISFTVPGVIALIALYWGDHDLKEIE